MSLVCFITDFRALIAIDRSQLSLPPTAVAFRATLQVQGGTGRETTHIRQRERYTPLVKSSVLLEPHPPHPLSLSVPVLYLSTRRLSFSDTDTGPAFFLASHDHQDNGCQQLLRPTRPVR
nr:hypothetical protein CFP56_43945 [Quercus suber]